ncbi:MAG: hypothetical protein LBG90_01920 [Spirochaetaceae bacterium]|jgi:hypothetical protein|nr:hypothetical protein [Spirochaetaceae bacterium]
MIKNSILAGLFLGMLAVSCKQSAIFYGISQEVEPVEPRIDGMPTNIVEFGGKVYAASRFSGNIQQYQNGSWSNLSYPGGKILELAATTTHLYVLRGDPGSATVSQYDGSNWATLSVSGNIQVIYGAGDYVFACVMTGNNTFDIYKSDGSTVTCIKTGGKLLTGAALSGTEYYLATAGDGIVDDSYGARYSSGGNLTGIIAVDDKVLGVTRGGSVIYGSGTSFTSFSGGVAFTGGLGLWTSNGKDLLLLGTQGSSGSTVHGYQEIVLTSGALGDMTLHSPGTHENSSVQNADKYNSSLRRHPVIGFLQAPDGILFAATVKNGLWAYRNNVWNAEE